LIDEFDPEKELRDIAGALAEPALFSDYVREKSAVAVSKFLVSLTFTEMIVLLKYWLLILLLKYHKIS
jgi:hypothetical protein